MERRKLGQLEVSAIGLGCATMTPFYGEPDPVSAVETICRAPELGIDLLDIDRRRGEYVNASKVGNLRRPDGTPTADGRPEYV
jgi:hypothetical protein